MEECDHKTRRFSDKPGMLLLDSDTYFLELSAHVSLKEASNVSFRGRKIQKFSILNAFLLKQKRRSAIKKFEVFLINLVLLYLVQLHIFWK